VRAGLNVIATIGAVSALSACTSGPPQPVTPIAVDAGRTAALVSSYRAGHGLGRVSVDSRLTEAAARQARAMAERDRIGHRVAGALPGRLATAGYFWIATTENLGAGYKNLDAALEGWRASPEHRKNLLNPRVTELGIAAFATPPGAKHRTYWALILAAPPEPVMAGPFRQALQ
jgi:uncharacterized protein YkwD